MKSYKTTFFSLFPYDTGVYNYSLLASKMIIKESYFGPALCVTLSLQWLHSGSLAAEFMLCNQWSSYPWKYSWGLFCEKNKWMKQFKNNRKLDQKHFICRNFFWRWYITVESLFIRNKLHCGTLSLNTKTNKLGKPTVARLWPRWFLPSQNSDLAHSVASWTSDFTTMQHNDIALRFYALRNKCKSIVSVFSSLAFNYTVYTPWEDSPAGSQRPRVSTAKSPQLKCLHSCWAHYLLKKLVGFPTNSKHILRIITH